MSTRRSIYTHPQDGPENTNGIHVFRDMDGWVSFAREKTAYEYTAGIAMRPAEARALAVKLLEHIGTDASVGPRPLRADQFPGQVGPE